VAKEEGELPAFTLGYVPKPLPWQLTNGSHIRQEVYRQWTQTEPTQPMCRRSSQIDSADLGQSSPNEATLLVVPPPPKYWSENVICIANQLTQLTLHSPLTLPISYTLSNSMLHAFNLSISPLRIRNFSINCNLIDLPDFLLLHKHFSLLMHTLTN